MPPILITPHLSLDEFSCHDGTDYPPEWIETRLLPLCQLLEVVREACDNHPITILSGYRTEEHNEALREADGSGTGVAKNSQHIQGKAADIRVEGLAPSDVYKAVMALYKAGKIPALGGCGYYSRWNHLDIRQSDGHLARWLGPGVNYYPAV